MRLKFKMLLTETQTQTQMKREEKEEDERKRKRELKIRFSNAARKWHNNPAVVALFQPIFIVCAVRKCPF